jgi:hypothetical protein
MLITSTIKGNVPFNVLGYVNGNGEYVGLGEKEADPGAAFRVVGDVPEHLDRIVVKRTVDGEMLIVPRSDVFTPVEVCPRCYAPMVLKKRPHKTERIAECPYHAHHQYEALYAASHDQKLNREQRRRCAKQAQIWLVEWKQTAKKAASRAVKMVTEQMNADISTT